MPSFSPSDRPAPVTYIANVMAGFAPAWFLCGGWAVDAWLGRVSRQHGDLDVSIFHDDQRALFDHLAGWHLIAHDPEVPGATTELWEGRRLSVPAHIHARPPGDANLEAVIRWVSTPGSKSQDGLDFEFMLNEQSSGGWLLNSNPEIVLPLERCITDSPFGLPAAAPEVLMFYKATAYPDDPRFPRRSDDADFRALVPLLGQQARHWLRDSIARVAPGHAWLVRLE